MTKVILAVAVAVTLFFATPVFASETTDCLIADLDFKIAYTRTCLMAHVQCMKKSSKEGVTMEEWRQNIARCDSKRDACRREMAEKHPLPTGCKQKTGQ